MSLTKVRASTLDLTGFAFNSGKGINVLSILGVDNTGATSSQTALQNYIDAFAGTNLCLYFPAGIYRFNQLKLAGTGFGKQVSFIGESRETVTISKFDPNNTLSLLVLASTCQLTDITFDWDVSSTLGKQTNAATGYNCVYSSSSAFITVDRCTFENAPYAGICIGADQSSPPAAINFIIRDCVFINNQVGVHAKNLNQGCKIVNNIFLDLAGGFYGGQLCVQSSLYTTIEGNTLSLTQNGKYACVLTDCTQVQVVDNNVYLYPSCTGIFLQGVSTLCNVEGNAIVGANNVAGINVTGGISTKIVDNMVQSVSQGIIVNTGLATMIANNIIRTTTDYAVVVTASKNTSVTGNNISDTQLGSIYIDSDYGPVISANMIKDPNLVGGTSGDGYCGIRVTTTGAGGAITGNVIFTNTGNPTYGIFANNVSGSNGVAIGNVCSSSRVSDFSLTNYATVGNV